MAESYKLHDPFLGKEVEISCRLTDRLRGRYATGPTMPNGEPEFGWRQFETPPIQHEAAVVIDSLVNALRNAHNHIDAVVVNTTDKKKRRNYAECLRIVEAALKPVGGNDFPRDVKDVSKP